MGTRYRSVGAVLAVIAAILIPACRSGMSANNANELDTVAEEYVKLVLAVGQHDPAYVDAYYGPAEWKEQSTSEVLDLDTIGRHARTLLAKLDALDMRGADEIVTLRHRYLTGQLSALVAYVGILGGNHLTFDEESAALYDAVAPSYPPEHFVETLDQLATLVPGDDALADRVNAFRDRFVIPPQLIDTVFVAAIQEARRRTAAHIELPANERFVVEYVTDKPWSGYNWYQGDEHSLIQVNTDLPMHIDRAIDLACHEGYPGHHVYNALLESHLVDQRGWVEFTVYPLYSPQSLIAEGTANFGIEVAFPGEERIAFERDVLFPLAGLDPGEAQRYYAVLDLLTQLRYAGNEAARQYLNGEIDREGAVDWLVTYALYSRERAEKRVDFIDTYRSYVINYNLGQDLVRNYIDSRGGTGDNPERRWNEFSKLISSPRLPSGLETK